MNENVIGIAIKEATNFMVLFVFFITMSANRSIEKHRKRYFTATGVLIAVQIVLEFISAVVETAPAKYRWLDILAHFYIYCLSPLIAVTLSNAIYPRKNIKFCFYIWGVYSVWLAISQYTGSSIFIINEDNSFSRGKGFFVFIIIYAIAISYFLAANISLMRKHKKNNTVFMIFNPMFVIIGTMLQLLNPKIRTAWTFTTTATVYYYSHYLGLIQGTDFQTRMPNHKSFISRLENIAKKAIIIEIHIKPRYGIIESQVLLNAAGTIEKFFKKFGECFRTGNKRFCVIIQNSNFNYESLCSDFTSFTEKLRTEQPELPDFNLKGMLYTKGDDLEESIVIEPKENA